MFHTAMGNAPQVHTQEGLKAAVTKKFTESLWVAAHKQEERATLAYRYSIHSRSSVLLRALIN